jgi:hypothetical protein
MRNGATALSGAAALADAGDDARELVGGWPVGRPDLAGASSKGAGRW